MIAVLYSGSVFRVQRSVLSSLFFVLRSSRIIRIPCRDLKVMSGCGTTRCPGARRSALRYRCRDQHQLHHRELFADALPRPAAKRKVGELRQRRTHLGRPAIRIEAFRVRKESRVTLRRMQAHEDHSTPRQRM